MQTTNSWTRRHFLQLLAGATMGVAALPPGQNTTAARAAKGLPELSQQPQATAPGRSSQPTAASTNSCQQTAQQLLDLAATIEAATVTFYFTAITTPDGFFGNLPTAFQRYLRVTLDEEAFHYRYLVDQQGASANSVAFYFPANIFAAGHFADFLDVMNTLETATVAMHLAAVRQLGEQNEPLRAEILGQIAAIEAEHRVIGREMAQNSPPAPNNFCYERADFTCAGEILSALGRYLNGGAGFIGPVALPDQNAVATAVGAATCDVVDAATTSTCDDTLADILHTAAQAEAAGIALYYHGITGGFFDQLHQPQQWYLQAALDEENHHLHFLLENGASPPSSQFFFPEGVFDDLAQFLSILDMLENIFIGAYLAAIQRLNQLGEPLLAEIAAQILGVESEHRVLGRVLAAHLLPHNRCLAQVHYTCIAQAAADLEPFLTGSEGFTAQVPLPTEPEIVLAVDAFGCIPVPPASLPAPVYLPWVAR